MLDVKLFKIESDDLASIEKYSKFVTSMLKQLEVISSQYNELGDIYVQEQKKIKSLETLLHITDIYVITLNSNPVGMLGITDRDQKFCRLSSIIIESEYRKLGIGDKALKLLFDIVKKNGNIGIVLGTYSNNSSAIKFYKRHGFEENIKLMSKRF